MNFRCIRSLVTALAALVCFVAGLPSIQRVKAATPPAHIYWLQNVSTIMRADLDGANMTTAVANTNGPGENTGDFVVDRRTNQIYWNTGFNIYRSNLDGSARTDLYNLGFSRFPADITIDPVTNQLFFMDGRQNAIYRSNLDGTGVTAIVPAHGVPSNVDGSSDMWLDPNAGKLYWNYDDAIHRTNLDGSQDEVLFSGAFGIDDFEVDPQHGKIYWASTSASGAQNSGAIRRANLDGTQQQTLVSNLWWANGIALDIPNDKMYYTDSWYIGPANYDATIRAANLDGTGQQTLINLGPSVFNRSEEIALDTAVVPEPTATALLCGFGISMFCLGPRKRR